MRDIQLYNFNDFLIAEAFIVAYTYIYWMTENWLEISAHKMLHR